MKELYTTPFNEFVEYDFSDAVSASHDTSAPNQKSKCDIPATKNKDCGGTPALKGKKC